MLEITSSGQAETLIQGSSERPLLVFKHSTRCPVSAHAAQQVAAFEKSWGDKPGTLARVLVVEQRPVSLWLSERLATPHASPQALVVSGGAVAWVASHFGITQEALAKAMKNAGAKE
jgi:bacillithiol system protein YtxJ